MTPADQPRPKLLRCGVYRDVAKADEAIRRLTAAGFLREQIDVVCADSAAERHFATEKVEHQAPSGRATPDSAAGGGLVGMSVGGLIALGLTTATGLPLLAMGPALVLGGAVAGGLVGAMETRGVEGAAADFYDQALTRGELLVAVDVAPADIVGAEAGALAARQRELCELADRILTETGALTVPLDKEV